MFIKLDFDSYRITISQTKQIKNHVKSNKYKSLMQHPKGIPPHCGQESTSQLDSMPGWEVITLYEFQLYSERHER